MTLPFPSDVLTAKWLQRYARPYLTIDCGDWTYGRPTIKCTEDDSPRSLTIGRYGSIGEEVNIHVGRQGRHSTNTLTTYPILLALTERHPEMATDLSGYKPVHADAPLDVFIGHDVWIGSRVTILAGVRIGTGAVIGVGAIVVNDVPEFAVAAGVPAQVKKYRHSEKIRKRLLAIRWWELQPHELWSACGNLLRSDDVEQVVERLEVFRATKSLEATPPLLGMTAEQIYQLFTDPKGSGRDGDFPRWPSPADQQRFTGGSGLPLLNRAKNFVEAMEKDGAFERPNWKGLDFGCGWGRIASYMLTRGTADRLDMCDAWDGSLDLARKGGFRNNIFKVSELLADDEIQISHYDFCYAMSVFTHLQKAAFENNIEMLARALAPRGRLYFTVRHYDYAAKLVSNGKLAQSIVNESVDFWHIPHPGQGNYGDTVVRSQYVYQLCEKFGRVDYLGLPETQQHLYRILRS